MFFDKYNQLVLFDVKVLNKFYSGFMEIVCQIMGVRYVIWCLVFSSRIIAIYAVGCLTGFFELNVGTVVR